MNDHHLSPLKPNQHLQLDSPPLYNHGGHLHLPQKHVYHEYDSQRVITVQSRVRGYLVRRDIRRQNDAATRIQSMYRGHHARKLVPSQKRPRMHEGVSVLPQKDAAMTIQRAFRGYQARRTVNRVRLEAIRHDLGVDVSTGVDSVDVEPLTTDARIRLRRIFRRFDDDSSNTLDIDEIVNVIRHMGFSYNEEFLAVIMHHAFHEKLDSATTPEHEANTLNFEEFVYFMTIFKACNANVMSNLSSIAHEYGYMGSLDDLTHDVYFNVNGSMDYAKVHNVLHAWSLEQQQQHQQQQFTDQDAAAEPPLPPLLHQQSSPTHHHNPHSHTFEDQSSAIASHRRNVNEQATLDAQHQSVRRQLLNDDDDDDEKMDVYDRGEEANETRYSPIPRSTQDFLNDERHPEDVVHQHASSLRGIDIRKPRTQPAHLTIEPQRMGGEGVPGGGMGGVNWDMQEEEMWIRNAFFTLLREYDVDNVGALGVNHLGDALRAMGLDLNREQLRDIAARTDKDSSGLIDYAEFQTLYHSLMAAKLESPDLSRIREVFESYDEDGNGVVGTDEFCVMVRRYFKYISQEEVDMIVQSVDANHDGCISFTEFQHFIMEPDGAGHVMLVKIIRSLLLSPEEHIRQFKQMPSTYRPSYLASMRHRLSSKLSRKLRPTSNDNGLLFGHLKWNASQSCLDSSRMGAEGMIAVEIELLSCSGVPMPDLNRRKGIIGRRVRVALFDANECVSNLHTCKASWRSQIEDEWQLNVANSWNKFVVTTDRPQTTLVIELCVLVVPDASQGATPSNEHDKAVPFDTTTVVAPHSNTQCREEDLVEMTCGFAQFSITWDTVDRDRVEVLNVMGGTFQSMSRIRASEILHGREGFFRKITKAFKDKPEPKLRLHARPYTRTSDKWTRKAVPYLPSDIIIPSETCVVVRMYRDVLADAVLACAQPLDICLQQNAVVRTFLEIANTPDSLAALAWLYNERVRKLDAGQRKRTSGAPSDTAKRMFGACVLEYWSLLSSYSLVDHVVGVNDGTRQAWLEAVPTTDPFTTFASDSMVLEERHDMATHSMLYMNYTPFHTRELTFHSNPIGFIV